MDTPRMLSGEELVSRGVTKSFATLPEIGLKDVLPNGSWLEQKQIQAALEARKHLVEVERIEKCGTLSQAEWRDDLRLAEVTRQTGSHWQYFGHSVGKKIYLRCEEALFLMEVNCLQLKHNDVTVSLQKAYSLLLDDTFTINQYKVFASLSRLGYKVFRHREVNIAIEKEKESDPIIAESSNNDSATINPENDKVLSMNTINNTEKATENNDVVKEKGNTEGDTDVESALTSIILDVGGKPHICVEEENTNTDISEKQQNNSGTEVPITLDEACDYVNSNNERDQNSAVNTVPSNNLDAKNTNSSEGDTKQPYLENVEVSQDSECSNAKKERNNNNKIFKYEIKILKLQSRKLRAVKEFHRFFEELPEMARKDIVHINTPEDFYIPKNIFVNKTTYKLNIESIKAKNPEPSSSDSTTSDEEDQSLRRIRNNSRSNTPQNITVTQYNPHMRLPRINQQFRPFLFWRPRPHVIHFNTFHPRQFLQNQFHPRLHFNIRPNPFLRPYPNLNIFDSNNDNTFPRAQKRQKNAKQHHLQAVKNLATKVKNHILSGNIVMPGNTHIQTIQALHKLLYTYNLKFNSKVRLTPQFDLVEEPHVVETIELDLDDEVQSKRPRLEENTFNENLNKLREIALKLKNLEFKGTSTSRHRRALSSAIKTFNKSYNADIYINGNYELIDRRHITLDSSSDSDCVVKENKKRHKKKKLRNPFYILKKLSESQSNGHASTSKEHSDNVKQIEKTSSAHDDKLNLDTINAHWLPKDEEFGKIEICPKNDLIPCVMNSCEDQMVYDFMKGHSQDYDDWLDAKVAFTKYLKELNTHYETEHEKIEVGTPDSQSGLHSIIGPEDCSDMPTLLNKLRIIKNNKTVNADTNIKIHFDVYNRDVPNFRKTNRPRPHFRIICYDGASTLPNGADIATLHAKYNDGIPSVFAIVTVGSISYLQINTTDLPVYLPTNMQ